MNLVIDKQVDLIGFDALIIWELIPPFIILSKPKQDKICQRFNILIFGKDPLTCLEHDFNLLINADFVVFTLFHVVPFSIWRLILDF